MTAILFIILLILVNALFVAAEFALVGAPRAAIERRAEEGDRLAKLVRGILRDPRLQDQYIATAQLGITFASLGLGMYGEHAVAAALESRLAVAALPDWFNPAVMAGIFSIAILTYFHIVFGEMIPKTMALQRAEQAVLWVARPVMWSRRILYPLVVSLNGLGNAVLRLLRIDRQAPGQQSFYTPEELEFVISESREGGLIREESARLVTELLRFGELSAGEVMTPRVKIAGLPRRASPREISSMISLIKHTRYPVYDRDLDHILGIVHVKDLLRLFAENRPLGAAEIREVPFLPETSNLEVVLAAMRSKSIPMAVIMDEYGGTAGLVTIHDLFEEVVGEISEDRVRTASVFRDDGVVYAAGTARLEELGEAFGFELEHEEVDTVSGLVLTLLDRPPVVGDTVEYKNVKLTVTAVDGHGVGTCRCTVEEREDED